MVAKELKSVAQGIKDPDPRRRVQAVRRLGRLPLEDDGERAEAVELLGSLVDDEADYVRWNVAMDLGQLGDSRGLPFLQALAGDEHANVRLRVALAVALIGDPDGLDILSRLSSDPYQIGEAYPVRSFAALALGVLGRAQGVAPLVQLAGDANAEVRWHATVALGDVGDEGGLEALVSRAADEIPFVRAHAAIALAELGSAAGTEAVQHLAENDPVERVRKIAGRSLIWLGQAAP